MSKVYMVVAQHNPEVFEQYVMPGLQKWELETAVSMDSNPNKSDSIFFKYNDGVKTLLGKTNSPVSENDIIGFCHEDVKIIDPFFIPKIQLVFDERGDIGLCGVVGASQISDSGAWWHNKPEDMRGHIIQENGETRSHLAKGQVGFFDDLVVVDGLLFFVRASLFMDGLRFDQPTYDGFDFYDVDTCISVLEKGFKVGCADILVQHRSIGDVSAKKGWYESRDKFVAKWKAKGIAFPITQKSFITDNITTVEV